MKRLGHPLVLFLAMFSAFAILKGGAAKAMEIAETIPKASPKDYIFFQVSQNHPLARSRDLYESVNPGYGLKYSHRLDSDWIVGLRLERKAFLKRKTRQAFSLLSFSNQSQAVFRLYHPVYFLVGTQLSYLFPTLKASPPFTKDPELATEIGAGLNASVWWLLSKHGTLEFNLIRWRGTNTNSLHGLELSLAYGQSI